MRRIPLLVWVVLAVAAVWWWRRRMGKTEASSPRMEPFGSNRPTRSDPNRDRIRLAQ